MKRTFKHLTFNDRLKIEAWLKAGVSKKDMACMLGVHWRTIYNELARGQYEHLNATTQPKCDTAPILRRKNIKRI